MFNLEFKSISYIDYLEERFTVPNKRILTYITLCYIFISTGDDAV